MTTLVITDAIICFGLELEMGFVAYMRISNFLRRPANFLYDNIALYSDSDAQK